MNRGELGMVLLLSVPVAVGVAAGVLKQTLGSQPLVAVAAGLATGCLVFAIAGAAASTREGGGGPDRIQRAVEQVVPEPAEATGRDLLVGAGVGAFVAVFLWYIPLSPLLGGAAAGFLQGGSRADALTAGTLSGVLIPVVALLFGIVAFLVAGAQVFGRFPFGPGVAAGLAVVGVVYAVGLGTVGGWLGGLALRDERRWGNEV
jgi:hypothetical protein